MASRAKSTNPGSRTARNTRKRKPETIDLSAKEVSKAEETASAKSADEPKKTSGEAASDQSTPQAKTETVADKRTMGQATEAKSGKTTFGRNADQKPINPSPTPAKSGEKQGARTGSMLISALLGGVVAIGGLGLIGSTGSADRLPLIGSIFEKGAEAQSTQSIEATVATLEANFESLQASLSSDQASANVDSRMAEIEAILAALSNQVEAVSTASGDPSRLNAVEVQINALSDQLATLGSSGDSESSSALSEIVERISQLETNLTADTSEERSALETRIASIEAKNTTLSGSVNATAQTLESLSARLDSIEASIESVRTSEKIARSVASNALGDAIESGDDLTIEIASVEALFGESEESKRLMKLSEAGLATRETLLSEFDALAENILAEPEPAANENTFFNRLLGSAKSLVKVRPAGPVEGESAAAILSRVRHQVSLGDYAVALEEWEKLPAETQALGENWATEVRKRMEAVSLFETISKRMSED